MTRPPFRSHKTIVHSGCFEVIGEVVIIHDLLLDGTVC